MVKRPSFFSFLSKKLDRMLASSVFSQVRVLVFIYVLVLLGGWLIARGLEVDQLGGVDCDAFWWSFAHTMDPGFLGSEAPLGQRKFRALSVFLSLSGFIIFGGLLISVLVNAYERRMRQAREGLARYSFKKDHGIILGWDRMGPATVCQLLSEGCREVVILSLGDAGEIRSRLKAVSASWDKTIQKRFRRIYIFHGSFDSRDELQGLRPWRAKKVVILGDPEARGSNSRNLQAAMRLAEMLRRTSHKHRILLDCHVAISHLQTYDLLQEIDLSQEDRRFLNFRPFNFYEAWARKVWCRLPEPGKPHDPYPPLFHHPQQYDEDASVVVAVIGFGQMGQAMSIQAARLANHANDRETEILVIEPDLHAKKNEFLSRYGLVEDGLPGVKFRFYEMGTEAPEIRTMLTELATSPKKILTVVIGLSDPDQSMATALGLPPEVLIRDIPILVRQETTSGLSEFAHRLREQTTIPVITRQNGSKVEVNDTRWDNIRFFGALDDYLLDDHRQEALAQDIHQSYLDYLKRKGWAEQDKPAQRTWESLSEKYRWSNRYQADAYLERLDINGFTLVADTYPEAVYGTETFEDDVVEDMARQEHNRWWVERALAGWNKGPRDDLRLMHPNMVPFDQLDEETKEFDREAIRVMARLLKKSCGLVITKLSK